MGVDALDRELMKRAMFQSDHPGNSTTLLFQAQTLLCITCFGLTSKAFPLEAMRLIQPIDNF
jgi:hypothetical protein